MVDRKGGVAVEGIDTTNIDQSTVIGQITMLVAVFGVLISAAAPFFSKINGRSYKSRVDIINERLELEAKNSRVIRRVNRDLSEWQLVARSLIRILKNEIVSRGGTISDTSIQLEEKLAEIDRREVDFGDESIQN